MLLQISKKAGCIKLKNENGRAVAELYRTFPAEKARVCLPASGQEAEMTVRREEKGEEYLLGTAEHPLAQAVPEQNAPAPRFAPALPHLHTASLTCEGKTWTLEVQKDLSVLILEKDKVVGEISPYEDIRPQRMALPENTPPALCAACYLFAENVIRACDLQMV